jgi:ubiquinone/menaquinone biosynthesis C-methylase UbiE
MTVDYDQISQRYDDHRNWEEATPRRLLTCALRCDPESVSDAASKAILEIGCGTGNVTKWLEKHWPGGITAVDKSQGMLRQAAPKLSRTRLVLADAATLPFEDDSFAVAVGSFVLHHLEGAARKSLWSELRRVVDGRGGVAFITSSHAQIRSSYLTRWFPSVAEIDCRRFADIPVLTAELQAAGFQQIETEGISRPRARGDASFIDKARSRFISTLELVPESEFAAGLKAMQAQFDRDGHLGDVSWHATILSARGA